MNGIRILVSILLSFQTLITDVYIASFCSYLKKMNYNAMIHGMFLTESELPEIKKNYLVFLNLLQEKIIIIKSCIKKYENVWRKAF